ncbi:MAG TPA: DNA methyltransferase, partial [Limnochordales bacterium]
MPPVMHPDGAAGAAGRQESGEAGQAAGRTRRRRAATKTYTFGVSRRESHDSGAFYARSLYRGHLPPLRVELEEGLPDGPAARGGAVAGWDGRENELPPGGSARPLGEWADRIYCHSSEHMHEIPDGSVALAFTSPPYNDGKEYDADLDLRSYLALIGRVAAEVYRVLVPGGRYVVNVANLGRKPYVPMHAYFYAVHTAVGFLPAGEIIWRKGRAASGSCAWGSWRSARAPR